MTHVVSEISTLGTPEFIKLVATYCRNSSKNQEIDPGLNSRGYSPEALLEAKRLAEKKFNPVTSLGLRFTKPLSNFESDIITYAWTLFENYERGLLPFPGSVSDQPAQIMEIFGTFQALRIERQENERKKLEKKDVGNKYKGKPRARG